LEYFSGEHWKEPRAHII